MAKITKTQSFNADIDIMSIFDDLKKYRIIKNRFISEAIKMHYAKEVEPYKRQWDKKKSDLPF